MKIFEREKKKFIRIIIGNSEEGFSGVKAPIKTLNVQDISVEQMWEKIFDMIQKETKSNNKARK